MPFVARHWSIGFGRKPLAPVIDELSALIAAIEAPASGLIGCKPLNRALALPRHPTPSGFAILTAPQPVRQPTLGLTFYLLFLRSRNSLQHRF